ncbi:MAG: Lycopene beta-cyclase [Hyphomicrobiaceae bacterium hypho_1]
MNKSRGCKHKLLDFFDVILVGGGLANSLIAERLATIRRNLSVVIVEAKDLIGDGSTWSYHAQDVTPYQDSWLSLIGPVTWPSQAVNFPSYKRVLNTGYRTIKSDNLQRRLASHDNLKFILSTKVTSLNKNYITLDGGRKIHGTCIIDGRGVPPLYGLKIGYQKFFGLECEMLEPHGLTEPLLMDAGVEQSDGYRFVYCLPFSPTLILIEDTYYSDNPRLDIAKIARGLYSYAEAKNWKIKAILREESGVLPIVLDGQLDMIWPAEEPLPRSGMRTGLFHHTTGYSLSFAATVADTLATIEVLNSFNSAIYLRAEAKRVWKKQSYFQLLNRMLFIAARKDEPRRIFERFYRLPKPLIERFYAADLNRWDKFRIFFGYPPVSVHRAIASLLLNAADKYEVNGPIV